MADTTSMTPAEAASKVLCSAHGDLLREAVHAVLRDIMEGEVTGLAGAGLHERSDDRLAQRNGYRLRSFDTRVGTLELEIPRLRRESYFPSFLEPRRRSEQALVAVVAEAYVNGVFNAQGRAPGGAARCGSHGPLHREPPVPRP